MIDSHHHLWKYNPHDYMLRPDFKRGIRQLRRFGLTYDILIFERHLPQTIRFVRQHSDQVFIVDHIAKPHRFRDFFHLDAVPPSRHRPKLCSQLGVA